MLQWIRGNKIKVCETYCVGHSNVLIHFGVHGSGGRRINKARERIYGANGPNASYFAQIEHWQRKQLICELVDKEDSLNP